MPQPVLIRESSLPADSARLQCVIREYVAWLGPDLSYRGFDAEMADFDRTYTLPSGTFFLAESGTEAAGCAGLLRHGTEVAELKRVFVRPAFRGHDLGRRLVEAVIAKARALGLRRLVLDAVPQTVHAQQLYERMGFEETAPYYDAVLPGTRFFAMTLR
ncbi:GNAT family N-acetyltransferase [Azohydromonas australica]|uniref:GNAT family N-acetyltransferase n=1 Tax=Azohydromonas australica TaxID=364039 RepID=UPI00042713E3|nr:GNAT family N-acetyltransferase [Azohydromonas australica]